MPPAVPAPATEPAPRVLIADDQELVRTGFRMILTARGLDVVGEAADGAEAVQKARELNPDVILMDIRMPGMDGLEATRRILAGTPDSSGPHAVSTHAGGGSPHSGTSGCRVIMLTTFDLDHYVYAALAAGASGFLLKDVTSAHLAAAIRLVGTGDALLAPSITRRLVERFADRPELVTTDSKPAPHRDLAALTPREREVLALMGRGFSNAELARELTLSEATVKTHVARIFAKLSLRDRAQAVVLAYETGLVSPGEFA
ncbi:response regulator transcription factor [Streptomyces sp. NPDC048442]|uniref:response regulator transcription factor n=1 Tax=Streptomyces sp. NPDC048442 TaxID=3154823 RepID=UPI00342B69C0